jgi:hypothetical protein
LYQPGKAMLLIRRGDDLYFSIGVIVEQVVLLTERQLDDASREFS